MPFEAELDPDLLKTLRALSMTHLQAIGELIRGVCESFGNAHSHRGLGIRDLGHGFYECRHGLRQRLLFTNPRGLLSFYLMGDHHEVKRFLKRHRWVIGDIEQPLKQDGKGRTARGKATRLGGLRWEMSPLKERLWGGVYGWG